MTEHHHHHNATPAVSTSYATTLMPLTAAQIPCCICGTKIYPNAANQCPTCLSQDFNLQDYIQRPASSATGNMRDKNAENQIVIYQCRNCRRFQRTEKCWEVAEHESSQLMSICLKHIPALQHNYHSSSHSSSSHPSSSSSNLNHPSSSTSSSSSTAAIGPLRLMDAQWIWTEPHCMRYKLRCTIQTELHQVRVQQRVQVLIHCVFKMCPDCTREFNHRTWQSVVQVRQRVTAEQQPSTTFSTTSSLSNNNNKANGLMILEQTLAKHKAIRKHVLKMEAHPNGGFDFYFVSIPHAQTFVSFLQRILPMRVRTSKKLVSTDAHSKHMAHMKHTMVCDMVPFQVHDLLVIHKSTSKCKLAGHLVLVTKLASVIHFIDAAPSLQLWRSKSSNGGTTTASTTTTPNNSMVDECVMELSAETYYKQEKQYRVLQSSHRLVRFVVLDVEWLDTMTTNHHPTIATTTTTPQSSLWAMAEVWVARESDMGTNDRTFHTVTHLGRQIEAGDVVLGYDLTSSSSMNLDDDDMKDTFTNSFTMPDIVLVKKAPTIIAAAGELPSNGTSKSNKKGARSSKEKRQQRRRPNDGKRVRELEEHGRQMGFIEEENVGDEEQLIDNDDMTVQRQSNDKDDIDSILYNTDMMNEVLALERELETLEIPEQQQQPDDNVDEYDP